jgi:hypothetical protein
VGEEEFQLVVGLAVGEDTGGVAGMEHSAIGSPHFHKNALMD